MHIRCVKMLKKIRNNKKLISFFLSIILGSIIIVPNIIMGHGIYNLIADFNNQQIPFNMLINYSIKHSNILWTWFNEMGSNFIGTFSFYNLFSPFNLIGYLFPEKLFPYLIGPIFIFKYGISGICSYMFLERYVKNKNYAILGSLLYTFSGFQLTNILFYHFHDVVAFFPLLLYSLDRLVYDNKKGRLSLVILLCAITNWFFFIGECIFVFIYFIIKFICKDYKINKKLFINLVFEVLIGILMSMFVLLPVFLFTISNPRITNNWTFIDMVKYPFTNYFEIVKGMFLPPEVMANRSLLMETNYSSVEAYLPVVGLVLVIPYLIKNKRSPYTILFIISLIFMFIPILNNSFVLFNTGYYARWFFMPILIMSLMSIKSIEDKLDITSGIKITIISLLVLILFSFIYNKVHSFAILDKYYLIVIVLEMVFGIIGVLLSNRFRNKNILILIIFIFIYVSIHGNYMIYKYKYNNFKIETDYKDFITKKSEFNKYKNYRFNSSKNCRSNIGYINKINNIRAFNSNISGNAFSFYNSVGILRSVYTEIDINNKELNNILGVRYIISCGDDIDNYKYIEDIGNYKIYENTQYKEFGYSVNDYMKLDTFNSLSFEDRIKALNEKIILDNNQIKLFKDFYPNNTKYLSNKFIFINDGFKSNIESDNDTIAIYQIPYDEGFKATNNNKKVDIYNVNNGFIGIKINKGKNNILVTYEPRGFRVGIIISLISCFIYLIYLFKIVYKKK